jgi:hypothetical protein
VGKFGGAAAERERAEAADGGGVAVRHRVGGARQHHAELGRDHVRDTLLGIAEVEDADAVLLAARPHGAQEGGAVRIGLVVAARLGGDGVVLHREGEVGAAHRAVLLLQRLKGVRGVQLVQHVAVDIDQLAAVDALGHQVGVPDFLEQGFGHGFRRYLWLALIVRGAASEGKHDGSVGWVERSENQHLEVPSLFHVGSRIAR